MIGYGHGKKYPAKKGVLKNPLKKPEYGHEVFQSFPEGLDDRAERAGVDHIPRGAKP